MESFNDRLVIDSDKKMLKLVDPFFPDLGIVIFWGSDLVKKVGYRKTILASPDGSKMTQIEVAHNSDNVWYLATNTDADGTQFKVLPGEEALSGPFLWLK